MSPGRGGGMGGWKLNLLDRVIFVAVGGFLTLVAFVAVASAFGWSGAGSLRPAFLHWGLGRWEASIGAAALALAGLHVLFFGLQRDDDEGIRQETEIGHVRISLRAIENLAHRVAKDIRGVKDVDVSVHPSPEGVAIRASLVVVPDAPVPVVCEEVGRQVRSSVRESIGIDVGDVAIEVRNIVAAEKGRVE